MLCSKARAGCIAMVLVGALFVGSMAPVWHGDVEPPAAATASWRWTCPRAARGQLERGAELGRFNMGSTVILLLPPGGGRWSDAVRPGQTLRVGGTLGTRGP